MHRRTFTHHIHTAHTMMRIPLLMVSILSASLAALGAAGDGTVIVSKFNYRGDTLYDSVEVMPHCLSSIDAHVMRNLRYPPEARDNGIQGKVTLGYVIDTAGRVAAAIVVQSSGNSYLDQEGLRVVWGLPPFSPGLHNDAPVPVYLQTPVTFRID